MNQYIKLKKQYITNYIKIIFGKDFSKNINEEFLKEYVNARYYNLYEGEDTLKNITFSVLDNKKEVLIKQNPAKKKTIENMCDFYRSIAYLDKITPNKNVDKLMIDIEKQRKIKLDKENPSFILDMNKNIRENEEKVDELLRKYRTSEFYLDIANYGKNRNIQKVNLRHSIKMPILYSNLAIEKAFSTGNTNEDKLFVEYNLISLQIIEDIEKGNFKKKYILEYASTLLEKKQKNARILKILSNTIVQEKTSLKIKYSEFLKFKDEVYDMIKQGYKISIVIDESFKMSTKSIEKLNIFEYILLNKNYATMKEVLKNKEKIIEI